jgi:hypothetical protein
MKCMNSKANLLTNASLVVLLVTGQTALAADPEAAAALQELTRRAQIGLEISPVPLRKRGIDPQLIGLGSYLVNALGVCNDCHTHPSYLPGGNPFFGEAEIINADQYLTGGRQFGPFTSANLTPDEFGRPAGLTFEEFKNVMRTGRDPDDPSRLLQVMPWPVYSNLSNYDLRAIYNFLRAIPSRPNNPNPSP